ncbi:MAG: 3'(2'),5'-bisphosphate nucleotidase [Marinilabiliales bacterium]|nr:MAG: 3'(2'),5'-bisphosphate nucleotidase [Marinilabiliales bacterium]
MLNTKKIISTIILAGKKTLEVYVKEDHNVSYKNDDSPLTQADRESNRIIINELSKTEIPVLSEEGRNIPFSERKTWDKFWMIDPLDGTKEFINRNGEFTINIALIEGGKPAAGFVYVPCTDELYIGILRPELFSEYDENVALKSNNASIGLNFQKIPNILRDQIVVMGSRSHMNEETTGFINNLKKKHPEMVFESRGSSLKICALAEGTAHYYPRFAPTMEWDTAAAHAVLLAAGGRIVQKESGDEMVYNKENLLNPHFLAVGPGVHG